MLRLMKVLLTIILLWSIYWFAAGWGLQAGLSAWFTEQQRQGWQAEYSSISSEGFPIRHITRIDHPTLADPGTGTAWRADWLEVDSPAIWPGRQTLRVAPTPQRFSYFDQTVVVQAQDMQAELHLAPGLALTLEKLALTSGPWSTNDGSHVTMGASSLQLAMTQTEDPEHYQLVVTADDFAPGNEIRKTLAKTGTLPQSFETLALNMEVTFDAPWDRTALELRRPQPRQIELKLADAHWGALRLKASGSLNVDESGFPTGVVALKIENWRQMLGMAEGSGVLATNARDGVERVLAMLAGLAGNPHDLDTQLKFRNGKIALGPIPLGPTPRLILR